MFVRKPSSAGSVLSRHAYSWVVASIVVFGLWLRWPTLYNGFFSDDMVAMAMAQGAYASPRAPLDLFDFVDGSALDQVRLMNFGSLPWWTVDRLRMRMLRPLASALSQVDQRLFGKNALPYHVHSMLWWVALLLAAAALFRRLFSPPLAAISLLLFALEEGQTLNLGWLASRGALVAMTFTLLGLLAHLRWRRDGEHKAVYYSALCFSLALLSGEWAFPLMGYVVAFELLDSEGSWRRRALALLPSGIPSLVFALVRGALGYGARNSGVYTDPLSEPMSYLRMIGQRMPVFFADMVFAVPAHYFSLGSPWRDQLLSTGWIPQELWLRMPGWQFWHLQIGVCAMLTVAAIVWSILPARPAPERRELRWLLLGALFSLLPMVSSFPHARLVLPASLACAAVSAVTLHECWLRVGRRWRQHERLRALLAAALAGAVIYFQVYSAGERSYDEARGSDHYFTSIRRHMVDAELDDKTVAQQRVVVLGVIEHTAMVFAPYARWVFGHPLPRSWWTLSAAPIAMDVYRPAPAVLELSALGGTFLTSEIEQLYRAERFPMRVGQRIAIDGLTVDIVRIDQGFPQTVRFTFDKSVDDPQYVFLFSGPEGLIRARLPEVGERVRFLRPTFANARLQRELRDGRQLRVACTTRPRLMDCRTGFFFADCGGDSEPVLACSWLNDCRWFLHGCVAEEYDPSPCRAEQPFCLAGSPFEPDSFVRQAPYAQRLAEGLQAWGERSYQVDAAFTVPVDIQPELHTRFPDVRCSGPHASGGPCGLGLADLADPQTSSLHFVFRGPTLYNGWALTVEMLDDRAGEMKARICRVLTPPLWTSIWASAAAHDMLGRAAVCAERGTLALSLFPIYLGAQSELRAQLTADFPDGLHVEAEL
jgi:hypothetical protein